MNTLAIVPEIGCTNRCECCPQDLLVSRYRGISSMSYDLFVRYVETVPSDVMLIFSEMVEPFQNPATSRMIRHAVKDRGFPVVLYTTLVGFREEDARQLYGVNLKGIVIHTPDQVYFKYPMDKWLEFYRIFKKAEQPEGFVANEAADPALETVLGIRIAPQRILSRAGNLASVPRVPLCGSLKCTAIRFRQMVLLPNGDAQLCHMDYGLRERVGNLGEQSYEAVITSPAYASIEERAQRSNSDLMCRHCERAKCSTASETEPTTTNTPERT